MGSRDVYSLLKRVFWDDRVSRKSVNARDGARSVGSSSSSTVWRERYKLVPARFKRIGACGCDGVGGSWLASRDPPYAVDPPANILTRRASIRLRALLGLERGSSWLSGSMLWRIEGDSPLI